MSGYDTEREQAPSSVVHQLGTNPKIAARSEWDTRKLSYLVPPEKMPSSLRPLLYALCRRDVVIHRKRFWESITDNYLELVNSIEGRGQNNIIRAENALKGIPVNIENPPPTPGVLDKLFNKEKVAEFERYQERKEMGLTE